MNKVGVWSARERVDWFADDPETILHWRETPDRPAPRAGHRRDQPGRPARRAGRHLEPLGRAAAADRGALRPVRRTRAGAVVVRDLRGRPVDPRRHPVRGDARARGRRPPVDHHAVDRAGAARLHHLRARVRHRRRVDAARRAGPARAARRRLGLPAAVHPAGRPDPGRRARPTRPPANGAAARSWPAPTRCAAPTARPRVTIAAMGAVVPEALAAADRLAALGRRGRRRVRHQPRPAVRRRAGPPRAGTTARELDPRRRSSPPGRAAPLVTVLDGHPHTLAFLAGVNQVRAAHLGVTGVRPVRRPRRGLPPPRPRHRQRSSAPPWT